MAEILNIGGLTLDILGVLGLFRWAPEKFDDPQIHAFFRVEGEALKRRERWKKLQPIRRRLARFSVLLIVVGFALQLLGALVETDWGNMLWSASS